MRGNLQKLEMNCHHRQFSPKLISVTVVSRTSTEGASSQQGHRQQYKLKRLEPIPTLSKTNIKLGLYIDYVNTTVSLQEHCVIMLVFIVSHTLCSCHHILHVTPGTFWHA